MKENKQTILADIHMLATDDLKASIWQIGNSEFIGTKQYDDRYTGRHLYATTDEKIKDGNWCIDEDKKPYRHSGGHVYEEDKKIVATTNPKLWRGGICTNTITGKQSIKMAKIDTTFLQPYVDAYSAGKPIKQVRLELSDMGNCNKCNAHQFASYLVCNYNGICDGKVIPELKLKPNTSVIIHRVVEQKYSFEQMVDAILNNTSMTVQEAKDYINSKYIN